MGKDKKKDKKKQGKGAEKTALKTAKAAAKKEKKQRKKEGNEEEDIEVGPRSHEPPFVTAPAHPCGHSSRREQIPGSQPRSLVPTLLVACA